MLYNEHIHVHCINSEINIYMPIVKELDIDKTQEKFTILEFHLRPSRCLNSWLHSNKFFVYITFLYYGQVYVNLRVIAKFVIILCINIYISMQCVSLLSYCRFTVFHLNLKRPCSGLPARRFCFTSKAGYIIMAKWRSG